MASSRSQVWSPRCYSSSPDARTLWMKHLSFSSKAGLKFKSPSLKISNDGQNSFTPKYTKLFPTGSESKRKGINVVTQNTSLSRKLELLDAYEDEYDGAIIDAECLPTSANAFAAILQSSLSYWKEKGKKGIWLKILESQADLVPIAIKSGFSYHHAEPGYVMLTCWLPDEPCMLPFTATHQVGIGAFIINENKEVLVVKEKKCPLRCLGVWKLPTGLINKSEEIFSGAIREVKEETGIDTSFLEVLAFRHAHNVIFEKSDLFFICMLKPLSFEITIDESEIEAAKWMPLDQLINQPFHREDSMTKNMIDICVARYEDQYRGFNPHRIMSKFDDRLVTLYYGDMEVVIDDDNGVLLKEPMCLYDNAAF